MKPMLAGKAERLEDLKFPLAVSPKLDGFRALVIDGVVMTRNLKPVKNIWVQKKFGHLEGVDGELIIGDPTAPDAFRKTSSGVTRKDGYFDVTFHIFDNFKASGGWEDRFDKILHLDGQEGVSVVPHMVVSSQQEIITFEETCLEAGYEGAMLRSLDGLYKHGRSTEREGWLLKLKRFFDSEAVVLGMVEKMHNGNELQEDELGRAKRTSHIENLIPLGTMGALIVRDIGTGVEFNIGTGFTDSERDVWWNFYSPSTYCSKILSHGGIERRLLKPVDIVKYKFFPSGSKDKPRFPTYIGVRDRDDL